MINAARKAVIVTGAGRGIGAATAVLAAARGYPVVINYLADAQSANALSGRIVDAGGRATTIQGDVSITADVKRMFVHTAATFGNPGAIVNNAGITGVSGAFRDVTDDTLRRVNDTNILGCSLCCREAIPYLSRKDGHQGGVIINISSAAATLHSPGAYVWYAASKSAVETLTLGLSKELAGEGIRVNAVSPGVIDTDIHRKSGVARELDTYVDTIPMGRLGKAEEIAGAVLWLLSEEAVYCNGTILRIAGGR